MFNSCLVDMKSLNASKCEALTSSLSRNPTIQHVQRLNGWGTDHKRHPTVYSSFYTCMCVYLYNMCIYIYIHMSLVNIRIGPRVLYVCMYVCVYIYIYKICVCRYIYIYIYIMDHDGRICSSTQASIVTLQYAH